jgi:hypothetical protein
MDAEIYKLEFGIENSFSTLDSSFLILNCKLPLFRSSLPVYGL